MKLKLRRKTIPLLLTASLAVSGCVAPGGGGLFCDVVKAPIAFPREVAAVVVQGARPEAVRIDAQNRYGAENCPRWPS